MTECRLADLGGRTAVHGETVAVFPYDLHRAMGGASLLAEGGGEPVGVGAADGHAWAEPGAGEHARLLVRDEPAALQGDDPVGGAGGLLGIGGGEQNRAALRRVRPEHAVQPVGFTGGEAVRGFVQDEGVRVGEERAGQAESAVHAVRQRAEALLTEADEPDRFEHFVGAPGRHPGRGAEHAQMTADGTGRMTGDVTEHHTDLTRGVGDAVQWAAPEVGEAAALLEFEHQSERRGLARARLAQECGDAARTRFEGHVVDGGRVRLAGGAGQSEGLDHLREDSVE